MTATEDRYQIAFEKFMENDQPTIEQHQEFIDALYSCAEDKDKNMGIYLEIALSHERIIRFKQEQEAK